MCGDGKESFRFICFDESCNECEFLRNDKCQRTRPTQMKCYHYGAGECWQSKYKVPCFYSPEHELDCACFTEEPVWDAIQTVVPAPNIARTANVRNVMSREQPIIGKPAGRRMNERPGIHKDRSKKRDACQTEESELLETVPSNKWCVKGGWVIMTFPPHSKIQRVQEWLNNQQPGNKFTARDIAIALDLEPYGVGCTLKWQDNVKKVNRNKSGTAYLWERVWPRNDQTIYAILTASCCWSWCCTTTHYYNVVRHIPFFALSSRTKRQNSCA